MGKRGANEGSIYRRADGRWCASVSIGYANGKRHRKYIYGATRREVQERLTAALAAHQQGKSIDTNDRLTVGQWLATWLAEPSSRRQTTLDRYRQVVRLYLEPAFGRIRLRQLSVQDIQHYKRSSRVSPRYTQLHLMCLSAALQEAMRRDLLWRNVVALAGSVSIPKSTPTFLSPDEARAFLGAISGHQLEALFIFALATGTRIAETVAVKWSDFDWSQRFVSVQRQATVVRGAGVVIGDVKTHHSRRSVALTQVVIAALLAHRIAQDKQRVSGGNRWHESDFVFTSRTGTPIGVKRVSSALRAVLAQLGLNGLTFHALRRSCGSLLLSEGVPLKVISEMLGHTSISVTADIYLSVIPDLQRHAAERMDAILTPNSVSDVTDILQSLPESVAVNNAVIAPFQSAI